MAYVRKTRDVYEVGVDYGYGHGFEAVAYEDSLKDAKRTATDYLLNDQFAQWVRVKKRRQPIKERTA